MLAVTFSLLLLLTPRMDRLVALKPFSVRWTGCALSPLVTHRPIVVAVYMNKDSDKTDFKSFIQAERFESRIVSINCIFSAKSKYFNRLPLNLLRGQAIRNVETSHYISLDVDTLPCGRLC